MFVSCRVTVVLFVCFLAESCGKDAFLGCFLGVQPCLAW